MRKLLIFSFLLSTLLSFSQGLTFESSKDILLRVQDEYFGLVHADNTGYIIGIYERTGKGLLGESGRKLILEKYDKTFQQQFSYEYGTEVKERNSIGIISSGSLLYWVVLDKSRSYNYNYKLIPINLEGKEGNPIELLKNKVEKEADIPFTDLVVSSDSSKVAFLANFDANKKNRQARVYVSVFGPQGEMIWDLDEEMKFNQSQFEILDYLVSNEGELCLVSKYYKDKKAKEEVKNRSGEKVPGYELALFKITKDGTSKVSLNLSGTFIHDARLSQDNEGNLICAGFSSTKHRGPLKGAFFRKFNLEGILINESNKDFSVNDLLALGKDDFNIKVKGKDKSGLDRDFDMGEIIEYKDGSIMIIAEENDLRFRTQFNPGLTYGGLDPFNNRARESMFRTSDDVIGIKINSEGFFDNTIYGLAKKQSAYIQSNFGFSGYNDRLLKAQELYLSYSTMNLGEATYMIFNDHVDNIERDGRKRLNDADRLDRMSTYILPLEDKSATRLYLFEEEDSALLLSPARSFQLDDKSYFFSLVQYRGQRDRLLRIGLMEFN